MVKLLYELDEHLSNLKNGLKMQFGLNVRETVCNHFDSIDILLTDPTYPFGKDWMPAMSFTIYLLKKKVVLKSIRLPQELQNKGIGSYCFAWLVELCKLYGIEEIEGIATESSKGFWEKKGFTHFSRCSKYQIK